MTWNLKPTKVVESQALAKRSGTQAWNRALDFISDHVWAAITALGNTICIATLFASLHIAWMHAKEEDLRCWDFMISLHSCSAVTIRSSRRHCTAALLLVFYRPKAFTMPKVVTLPKGLTGTTSGPTQSTDETVGKQVTKDCRNKSSSVGNSLLGKRGPFRNQAAFLWCSFPIGCRPSTPKWTVQVDSSAQDEWGFDLF